VNQSGVINHCYSITQAKILLDLLQDHTAETLKQGADQTDPRAINAALDKLRLELFQYIESDDGLGLIVPSRDDKGLI